MRFRPAIRAAYLKGQQIAQITLEGDFNFSFARGGTCEQLTLPEAMGSQYGPHIFNVISVIVIAMSRGNRDTRSSIYIYIWRPIRSNPKPIRSSLFAGLTHGNCIIYRSSSNRQLSGGQLTRLADLGGTI